MDSSVEGRVVQPIDLYCFQLTVYWRCVACESHDTPVIDDDVILKRAVKMWASRNTGSFSYASTAINSNSMQWEILKNHKSIGRDL